MLNFRQFLSGLISEGGNAIKTKAVSRIKREHIDATIKKTVKALSKFGVSLAAVRPIGSTGKKADSGDIDLAVLTSPIAKALKTSDLKTTMAELAKHIRNIYGEAHVAFGNTISFSVPIEGGEGYAQMDFMFTDDLERASFAYHAPAPAESAAGGAARNQLLMAIAMFHGDRNQDPTKTEFTRHWMDLISGRLHIGHESGENGKRVIKDKQPLSLSPDAIVKEILGREFSVSDAHSVESLYAALKKSRNFSPATKAAIITQFKNSATKLKMPIPSSIK